MEGKCARDVTRKEEAVVKEARDPNSQSGTSRYKLGNVVSSAFGRFSLSRRTSGREEGGEKIQRRGGRSEWRAL